MSPVFKALPYLFLLQHVNFRPSSESIGLFMISYKPQIFVLVNILGTQKERNYQKETTLCSNPFVIKKEILVLSWTS